MEVERPDYTDVEIEHADLRDIRYRLNVLDHKLDTLLSKLEGQEKAISQSDSRWRSAIKCYFKSVVYMEIINRHMVEISKHMDKISDANAKSHRDGDGIYNQLSHLRYDIERAVYELTSIPWDSLEGVDEPYYEHEDKPEVSFGKGATILESIDAILDED